MPANSRIAIVGKTFRVGAAPDEVEGKDVGSGMRWGHTRTVRVVDGKRDGASGGTKAEVKEVVVCVRASCHVHPLHHHRRPVDVQHASGEANHRNFKLDVDGELVVHAWCGSIAKDRREDRGVGAT